MRLTYYLGLDNNKLAMFCRNHSWCKHRQPKLTSRGVAFFSFCFFVVSIIILAFVFFLSETKQVQQAQELFTAYVKT